MLFSLALQHKSLIVVWHLICTLSSYNHWSISELGREQKFLDDIECHSVTHLFSFILISLWKEEGFLIYNFPGSSVVMFHDILTGLAVPLWTWNDLASFSLNEVLSGQCLCCHFLLIHELLTQLRFILDLFPLANVFILDVLYHERIIYIGKSFWYAQKLRHARLRQMSLWYVFCILPSICLGFVCRENHSMRMTFTIGVSKLCLFIWCPGIVGYAGLLLVSYGQEA
jgi:hypothetical protein